MEDPSRVIVTASIAGLGVGSLGENATFGYSASKGTLLLPLPLPRTDPSSFLHSCRNPPHPQLSRRARAPSYPLQ